MVTSRRENIMEYSHVKVKFIYFEKATKFCKISNLLLPYVVQVKSKVEISQNFVAFSEYMNFNAGPVGRWHFTTNLISQIPHV